MQSIAPTEAIHTGQARESEPRWDESGLASSFVQRGLSAGTMGSSAAQWDKESGCMRIRGLPDGNGENFRLGYLTFSPSLPRPPSPGAKRGLARP